MKNLKRLLPLAGVLLMASLAQRAEAEIIPADQVNVVSTTNLTFTNEVSGNYQSGLCEFNEDAVKQALDCDALTTDMLISKMSDGSYYQFGTQDPDYNADAGFWYDEEGNLCSWGDGSSWFICYYGYDDEWPEDAYNFYIGNMEDVYTTSGNCNIGFLYEGNAVMFEISVEITEKVLDTEVEVIEIIDLAITDEVNGDYQVTLYEYDFSSILQQLGCSSMSDTQVVSIDPDYQLNGTYEVLDNFNMVDRGYYYNLDGTVGVWGDGAGWYMYIPSEGTGIALGNMAYVYDATGVSNIGLAYNGKAVMFNVSITIKEKEEEEAPEVEVIEIIDLAITDEVNGNYQVTLYEYDFSSVLQLLGCVSMSDTQVVSIDPDYQLNGTYEVLDGKNQVNRGYYYNLDGTVGVWGDGAGWYMSIPADGSGISLGNMAGIFDATGISNIGLAYEGKAVIFNVNVTIVEKEVAPEPVDVVGEEDLSFEYEVSYAYDKAPLTFDAEAVMEALGCDELTTDMLISLDENGMAITSFTANTGFWYNADGEVCDYSDGAWFIEYYGENPDEGYLADALYVGCMNPEDVQGTCNAGFAYEGKAYIFNVSVKLSELVITSFDVVKTIDLTYTQEAEGMAEAGSIEFDAEEVEELLGCSVSEAVVISLDEEGQVLEQTATNGYWYDNDGEVCPWESNSENMAYYIEYHDGSAFTIGFNGQDVEATSNIGFYNKENGKAVMFNVAVSLTVTPIEETDIVEVYEETIQMEVTSATQVGYIEIDVEEVTGLLGCDSLSEAMVITLGENDEVIASQTANNGFWYDADGEVCDWGSDAAWFIEYRNDGQWTVGIYSLVDLDGACNIGFYFDGKVVLYDVTVKVTVEDHTTGIEALEGGSAMQGVYNMQGIKVGEDLKNLAPGLYIVNGKKVYIRK